MHNLQREWGEMIMFRLDYGPPLEYAVIATLIILFAHHIVRFCLAKRVILLSSILVNSLMLGTSY